MMTCIGEGEGGLVSLCGPGPGRLLQCSQDYISMIANSLFVYFAVIIQLYLFLCYKMNDFNSKVKRNSVIKDFVWTGSILLVLIQIFKVWELFLVRAHINDALYPVAAIEPVLTLTSLLLALIFIHTCFREEKYLPLSLLTGYTLYSLISGVYRINSFIDNGLSLSHSRLTFNYMFTIIQGFTFLALLTLHTVDFMFEVKIDGHVNSKTQNAYNFSSANIVSKLTFFWLMPILKLGYHMPLEMSDLTPLPSNEQVKEIFLNLKTKLKTSDGLFKSCLRLNKCLLICGAILRLFSDFLGFAGALGIQVIVSSIENDTGDFDQFSCKSRNITISENNTFKENDSEAPAVADTLTVFQFIHDQSVAAVIILLASLSQGGFSQLSSHVLTVVGTRTRNALQVCIYDKALQLSIGSRSNMTSKESTDKKNDDTSNNFDLPDETSMNNIDLGGILNLATEDTLNIREFFWNIHYIWSLPLKICIIIVLVYFHLGISAASGCILGTFITIPCQFLVGKAMSTNNKNIMQSEDKRLQASTEALQNMKTIKLNCWENIFMERINIHRRKELALLAKDSLFWSVMAFFASISTLLVTTITIGIYTGVESEMFSAGELFTALALFNQLAVCLSVFPVTVPIFIKGFVSRNRIKSFLDRQEALGTYIGLDTSTQVDEDERLVKEDDEEEPLKVNECPNIKRTHILKFTDASFAWQKGNQNVLHNLNLTIPNGELTVIMGPSGSGKTSLISAILKEMIQTSGIRELDSVEKFSKFSVLPQNPWILNATVKDNILFGRPYKEKRFNKTVEGCDLKQDLEILPDGLLTEVGERGVLVSGGQRQRICFARCVYSTAPIVILDSPFSAVDNNVANNILEKAIINILMKKRRTVILTTNNTSLLKHAKHIICLENGKIKSSGTLEEIMDENPILAAGNPKNSESVSKSANMRWKLLKTVTKCGMVVRNSIEMRKKQQLKLPKKQSVQDFYVNRGGSRRVFRRPSRMDSSCQLNLHHDIILPSDGAEESLVDMEGLLSSRHKHLLMKCLAKKESFSNTLVNEESQNSISSETKSLSKLKRLQSERFLEGNKLNSFTLSELQPLNENCITSNKRDHSGFNNIRGGHLTLTPKESILSLVHNKVLRLTSTASAASGVSGFSDDFQDDDNDDGLLTNHSETIQEKREYGSISHQVYWKYIKAGGLFLLAVFLFLSVAIQSTKVYMDFLLGDWVESEDSKVESIRDFFTLFSGLSLSVIVLTYFYNILGQWIGASARTNLHEKMLQNLFQCPIEMFEAYPIGRILNRLSCDMFVIDQKLPSCVQRLVMVSLICLSSITVSCIQCPVLILFAVPLIAAYWYIQHFYRCSSRELQRLDSLSRAPVFSHFSDTLTGLVTIRSFRVQPKFISELCEKVDANTGASLMLQSGARWLGLSLDLIGSVIVFTSVMAAILMGRTGPAGLGLLISYSLLIPIYLAWVVKFVADIENYMNAVERVLEYTELDKEEDMQRYPVSPETTYKKGVISLDNVYLGYHLDNRVIIGGLSLTIPARQRVAICGRTGSGKSTLIMGIMRMAKKIQGKICIDGIETSERPLAQLRQFISVLHQDTSLLSGSLRLCLDPSGKFTDAQLWQILQLLELQGEMSDGLDTEVEDGSVGGAITPTNRQLISLARVMLTQPRILILDEATSALESSKEARVQALLLEVLHLTTIITVAHRLANITEYDRVLVMGEGRILEDGNPKELLKKPMGFFTSLYRQEQKALEF